MRSPRLHEVPASSDEAAPAPPVDGHEVLPDVFDVPGRPMVPPGATSWLRARRVMLLAGLLLFVMLVGLVLTGLAVSRSQYLQKAQLEARNLAAVQAQAVAAELDRIDLALRNLLLDLQPLADRFEGREDRIEALLYAQQRLIPEVQGLRISDLGGTVRFTPQHQGGPERVNIADRDYFQGALASDGLVVSRVLRSRVGLRWGLVLARRVSGTDGRPVAVLHAFLPSDVLQQRFAALDLGPDGAISLRGNDLSLVARHGGASPELAPPLGSTSVSPAMREAMRLDPRAGSFIATGAFDQVERANAYLAVPGHPLIVSVGLGTQDFLRPWRVEVLGGIGLVLLATAVCGASAMLLRQAWRRESLSRGRLDHAARRYRSLLHTASDGIHVLDRDGRLVEFGDAFATLLGSRTAGLAGRRVDSWDLGSAARDAGGQGLGDLALGSSRVFETRYRRDDGETIEVEVAASAVDFDDRTLIYCTARDISGRKRAEAELAAISAERADLYDHAPCAYYSLDAEGRFVRANAVMLDWLDCSTDALLGGHHLVDFLDADSRMRFAATFPDFLRDGRIAGLEFVLIGRQGRRRRVSVSATAVRDAEGRYVMSRSVMHDITELAEVRERLHELVREQTVMLENDLVGIARLHDRHFTWVNRAVGHLLGYEPRELIGQSSRLLYFDQDSFERVGAETAALEIGAGLRVQLPLRRRDGSAVWIELNSRRLGEDRQALLSILVDISAQKQVQAQAEYLALHDSLTSLPNRRLLHDRLQLCLAQARREGRGVAVAFIDLDGFKPVNDRHGHAAGDTVLRQVAGRLQAGVRAGDTVARLGGDEFVLVLAGVDGTADINARLARLDAALAAPYELAGIGTLRLSASIGVVRAEAGDDVDALLAEADARMYESKQARRAAREAPPGDAAEQRLESGSGPANGGIG